MYMNFRFKCLHVGQPSFKPPSFAIVNLWVPMKNGPFINEFHIETSIHRGFSIAVLDYKRVNVSLTGL